MARTSRIYPFANQKQRKNARQGIGAGGGVADGRRSEASEYKKVEVKLLYNMISAIIKWLEMFFSFKLRI